MYRCEVCDKTTPPNQSRLVIHELRELTVPKIVEVVIHDHNSGQLRRVKQHNGTAIRTEISRELQVCTTCHSGHAAGLTIEQIRRCPPRTIMPAGAKASYNGQPLGVTTSPAIVQSSSPPYGRLAPEYGVPKPPSSKVDRVLENMEDRGKPNRPNLRRKKTPLVRRESRDGKS